MLLVSAALAPSAAAQSSNVTVFAPHYVFAARAFDSADALAAAAGATDPRSIGLDSCGAGTTRALMAAVHRLRRWPLHLRAHDAGDAACANAVAFALPVGLRPLRGADDDIEVDRYWRNVAP